MKKDLVTALLTLGIVCMLFSGATAQIVTLHETFEDRDLTVNPAWTGDLADFTFEEVNGNTQLRLDADPDPSRTQIRTSSTVSTGTWEFFFSQEFNPSNLNRSFIFLMADREDLNYLDGSSVNGYAVRTGDNQSPRRLKLVRFDNGNQTVLMESDTELEESAGYRVKVERSEDGLWQLFMSKGYDSEPSEDAPAVTDIEHTSSSYFGLLLRYSSGNTANFYFDDFIITNSEPFKLRAVDVVSADRVSLLFNYPLDPGSVTPGSVMFTGLPQIDRAEVDESGFEANYSFADMIDDGEYSLTADGLRNVYDHRLEQGKVYEFSYQNPFFLETHEVTGPRSVEIGFSLPVSSHSVSAGNFEVNGSIFPIVAEQPEPGFIRLEFSSDLPAGLITVAMKNIENDEGWRIRDGTEFTTFWFREARPGDLVINEILYRRAAAGEPQFVEIFNNTDRVYDLSGWILETDRGAAEIGGEIIRENDYLGFTDMPGFSSFDERMIHLQGFQSLRTTGDAVVLRNEEGVAIDSLFYEPEWGGNSSGISLERKDPEAISIDPVNWGGSSAESGSTPLQKNSRFQQNEVPPSLIYAGYLPEERKVVARFSEFVQPHSETRFTLNGQTVFAEDDSGQPGAELFFRLNDIPDNRDVIMQAEKVYDFQNNSSDAEEIPVSRPPVPGDLVFNEVMFDPLRDDFDGLPNQTEYVELANRQNYAISLEGIHLHDRQDERGEVRRMEAVTTVSKWIPARGFALLYADDGVDEFTETGNTQFFGLDQELEPHALQFSRTTLGLTASGREVWLSDSLANRIDMVEYSPDWHNPNLIDTKGISLERISPHGETNDPDNWGSNAMAIGGTPGRENSIHQLPAEVSSGDTILLEPNPFSPDGDGHEDHLFISYRFEEPDFMLRVRIFDRYGRLVRNLADSHHAGFEGSLTWDGRMDNGVTSRIGIYIVHIEAYNSSTGERREFKETAVLARQF